MSYTLWRWNSTNGRTPIWTSPNGRITHTYMPQTMDVYVLYMTRGWTLHWATQ